MQIWEGVHDAQWDVAQEQLLSLGVTDGLPVVPPTRQRVEKMLEDSGANSSKIVAILPPASIEVTWYDVAFNAVMAGCIPAYLPVVAAAVEALAADEFNLFGIASTTGSATPILIVNGPIVRRIGLNSGVNLLGPGNRANACIGRAVNLILRNVCDVKPGEFDMATIGQPAKYTCCFAENVDSSPWSPFHTERGFATNDDVVTVIGISGSVEVADSVSGTPEDLAQTFAQSMLIAGTAGSGVNALLGSGEPLIIMSPEIAESFARGGYSKSQVKAAIFDRAILPLDRLSSAVRSHLMECRRSAGDAAQAACLRVANHPEEILIVVAGGVGIKSAYLPTWGGVTRSVSRAIQVRGAIKTE